jgi:nitroreductase
LPVEVILKQHYYNNDGDRQLITDYDEQVRRYYRTRTGGTKDNSWSEQISDMLVKEARPHMLAFLQSKGFLLK